MKLTYSQKRGLSWGISLLMSAAMFGFMFWKLNIQYDLVDDAAILRAFMGYESGTPANFHIYVHGLLAWPLYWLSVAVPETPWFTWAQLALMFVSCVVIGKSIMQVFLRHEKPLWLGAVLAAAFLLTLTLKYVTRLTFTQTASILGAAAVLQMFSIDHSKGWKTVLGMAGAMALTAYAYAIRQVTVLPILAFCGLAFAILFVKEYGFGKSAKRSMKPMILSLCVIAAAFAALLGWRMLETNAQDEITQKYLEWQDVNTEVIDFYGAANLPPEAVELVGWSDITQKLAHKWCFLDSEIDTADFRVLNDYMHENEQLTAAETAYKFWDVLSSAFTSNDKDMLCLSLAVIALIVCLIGACFQPGKRLLLILSLVFTVLGFAAMMVVLALGGRMPIRTVLTAALPAAALVFGLLPACLPACLPSCKGGRILAILCAALCVIHTGSSMAVVLPDLFYNEEMEMSLGSAMGDLEEYAIWEPDSLFIYDDTLMGSDLRAFPEYPEGMPTNITFWGGWTFRSPQSVAQFERWDIDLYDFDPATLLRDDVFVVSGRADPAPVVITEWLREQLGENIDYELWSEYGNVFVFHYYEY